MGHAAFGGAKPAPAGRPARRRRRRRVSWRDPVALDPGHRWIRSACGAGARWPDPLLYFSRSEIILASCSVHIAFRQQSKARDRLLKHGIVCCRIVPRQHRRHGMACTLYSNRSERGMYQPWRGPGTEMKPHTPAASACEDDQTGLMKCIHGRLQSHQQLNVHKHSNLFVAVCCWWWSMMQDPNLRARAWFVQAGKQRCNNQFSWCKCRCSRDIARYSIL